MEVQRIIDTWLEENTVAYTDLPIIVKAYFKEVNKKNISDADYQRLQMSGLENLIDVNFVLRNLCIVRDIIFYELYDQSGQLISRYK